MVPSISLPHTHVYTQETGIRLGIGPDCIAKPARDESSRRGSLKALLVFFILVTCGAMCHLAWMAESFGHQLKQQAAHEMRL
ncbi:hypothetical protein VTO42DRAFT_1386 [Malbranchea cinnamomea]